MHATERRTSERILVRAKVTLHLGPSEHIELWSHDMSVGGVCLECPSVVAQDITPNTKVQLTVHYSPEESDRINAEVVHVAQGNRTVRGSVGLRFDRESGIQHAA